MRRLQAYLPVLIWMSVIFFASTSAGSTQNTGRIIRPILRWFKPDVTEEEVKAVQAVVRKSGHVSEYAVLALLVWRARYLMSAPGARSFWSWPEFWIAVGFCAAYACTDEFHQLFVATRGASPIDVMIDTAGAAAGLLMLWWLGRRRKAW